MDKVVKYVVKVKVSYVKFNFEFSSISGACNFMNMFLDHFALVDRDDDVKVYMERVEIKPEVETEKEEKENE